MDNLTYEHVYESCKKELAQQLDLDTNCDHFVTCFRNISEENLCALFALISNTTNMATIGQVFIDWLDIESAARIERIAVQQASALMENLS